VLGIAAAAVITALSLVSFVQTSYWRNSETLWVHTLAVTSNNAIAQNNFGAALLGKTGREDDAIAHLQKALEFQPDYAEAHDNLGSALFLKGRVDEAIAQFQKALEIKPDSAEPYNNLGLALLQKGRVDEAIAQFQKALEIQPDSAEAYNNLCTAFGRKGQLDKAITYSQKALEIQPDYAEAHNNLGSALFLEGRVDEAIAQFQKTLEIQPDSAEPHNNLGNALRQKGRISEAIPHYQKALEIQPQSVPVQNNLAWVLATCPEASLRNGAKAVELAEQANQSSGNQNPLILRTLAAAYAEAGRFPEAVTTAQRALQLATAQTNSGLGKNLEMQIRLYQAGSPFRDPSLTDIKPH
jgi:superkiller protein 3